MKKLKMLLTVAALISMPAWADQERISNYSTTLSKVFWGW